MAGLRVLLLRPAGAYRYQVSAAVCTCTQTSPKLPDLRFNLQIVSTLLRNAAARGTLGAASGACGLPCGAALRRPPPAGGMARSRTLAGTRPGSALLPAPTGAHSALHQRGYLAAGELRRFSGGRHMYLKPSLPSLEAEHAAKAVHAAHASAGPHPPRLPLFGGAGVHTFQTSQPRGCNQPNLLHTTNQWPFIHTDKIDPSSPCTPGPYSSTPPRPLPARPHGPLLCR